MRGWDGFLPFPKALAQKAKHKQPCPRSKLRPLSSFPKTITVTLCTVDLRYAQLTFMHHWYMCTVDLVYAQLIFMLCTVDFYTPLIFALCTVDFYAMYCWFLHYTCWFLHTIDFHTMHSWFLYYLQFIFTHHWLFHSATIDFYAMHCWFLHTIGIFTGDCEIVVSEFKLQSRYYVHFRANTLGKGMNPLSSQLNSTTTVLQGEWLWY